LADFELVSSTGELAFPLRTGSPAVLGRASTAELTVVDGSISRHHARLTCNGDAVVVEDLHSTNGTFVNDAPVTQAIAADGDVVQFGHVAFRIRRAVVPLGRDAVEPEDDDELGAGLDRTVLRALPIDASGPALLDERPASASAVARPLGPSQEGRLRRLELLLEVSRKFSQQVSLDALLETIVDVTCRIMHVHRAAILIADERTGRLAPRVSRQRGAPTGDVVRLPQSILRRVTEDRVAVRTDDAGGDVRFLGPSVVVQNVRGAMCTPLLSSTGEVLGAIYVDNRLAVGSYTDEDLEFLVSFGGIAAAAVENRRLAEALRARAVTLSNFERYFAPSLAAAIASERAQIQLGGAKRAAVILFSDVRGFSTLSEGMGPEAVVALLNEYFREMVDIVFEHGGTLDKFIGDSIMANWGAPLAFPDDADRALRAAIDMQRELRSMNETRRPDQPRIEVGIGINRGEVFVGNVGSHRRLEYTVIGDPVNVASRLCSTAGRGEILISEPLYEALLEKPEVEALEPVRLRGRAGTTGVYRVRW
jgi:adenylate cyclase